MGDTADVPRPDADDPPEGDGAPVVVAASDDPRPFVLAVEDEPWLHDIITRIIDAAGCRGRVARDGQEAWEFLDGPEGQQVELLFTDVRMPRMDGQELARRARRLRPDLPIVMVTGWDPEGEPQPGFVDEYLTKPYKPDVMAGIIRTLIGLPPG